jgi:hypothetical protein
LSESLHVARSPGRWSGSGGVALQDISTDNGSKAMNQPPGTSEGPAKVQLSPEVRQAIAEEVSRQLAAETSAAQGSSAVPQKKDEEAPPPVFDSANRVFVVSNTLDVMDPRRKRVCADPWGCSPQKRGLGANWLQDKG